MYHFLIEKSEDRVFGLSYNLKRTVYWYVVDNEVMSYRGLLTENLKKDILNFLENEEEVAFTEEVIDEVNELLTEKDLKNHYYRGK